MRRTIPRFFWALALLSVAANGCATVQSKRQAEKESLLSRVKSTQWKTYVGKKVTLEGYFVDRPVPMLLTSMRWLNINSPIPETEYIRLSGKGIQNLPPEKFYGALVRLKGTITLSKGKDIDLMRGKLGDTYPLEFTCPTPPIILQKPQKIAIPEIIDLCRLNPKLCLRPPLFLPTKYALLLSGGANAASAHARYWNDLTFMYNTLRNKYGFSDENIVVVYKDGTAEDSSMTVDYAADTNGVQAAFQYLQNRITSRDLFVFFATNHGGGFLMEEANARNVGGRVDTSHDETDEAIFEEHLNADLNGDGDRVDQVQFDERIYLYNSTQDLWDDDLAGYLNQLKYDRMLILLEQCFGGGFVADLRGERRVIVSAASEYEFSWAGAPGNHDMFSYHFTAALAGQTHDGTAVNADTDNDGKVSALEAFNYAASHDTAAEHPFYEDSKDGRGHNGGSFPLDGDGVFGASLTLD